MFRKYSDSGYFLWNYAIDVEYQKLGYGTKALKELIDYLSIEYNVYEITTTYTWGNEIAKHVYEKIGFIETNIVNEHGIHEVNMIYKILKLELLKNNDEYLEDLIALHNNPNIKKYIKINSNYFEYILKSLNSYYYKILLNDKLAGGIQTENENGTLYLSVCIDPKFQGKGYAKKAIEYILQLFDVKKVCVYIDKSNISSIGLFEALDFKMIEENKELYTYVKYVNI